MSFYLLPFLIVLAAFLSLSVEPACASFPVGQACLRILLLSRVDEINLLIPSPSVPTSMTLSSYLFLAHIPAPVLVPGSSYFLFAHPTEASEPVTDRDAVDPVLSHVLLYLVNRAGRANP